MKKVNNKGFMLTETLIVSTLLITVLLVVFVQFKNVNKKITNGFKYDKVSSQYNLYNIKLYIEQIDFSVIVGRLDSLTYVDLTTCDNSIFEDDTYCKS
ncbi:MAG TPA: hypothetical protein PLV83_01835, partial [Bacilli bacterium]|nr:hypothetical protein [Bacilli bacterium]